MIQILSKANNINAFFTYQPYDRTYVLFFLVINILCKKSSPIMLNKFGGKKYTNDTLGEGVHIQS